MTAADRFAATTTEILASVPSERLREARVRVLREIGTGEHLTLVDAARAAVRKGVDWARATGAGTDELARLEQAFTLVAADVINEIARTVPA
jgi:hypothetical protein